jgi:hypothetical protein
MTNYLIRFRVSAAVTMKSFLSCNIMEGKPDVLEGCITSTLGLKSKPGRYEVRSCLLLAWLLILHP